MIPNSHNRRLFVVLLHLFSSFCLPPLLPVTTASLPFAYEPDMLLKDGKVYWLQSRERCLVAGKEGEWGACGENSLWRAASVDVDKGWRIHKWEPTEGQSSKPRPQGRRGPLRSVKSLLLKFHRSLFQLPSHTCLSLTSAALPTLGPCHAVPAFSDDGGLLRTQADCLREAGECVNLSFIPYQRPPTSMPSPGEVQPSGLDQMKGREDETASASHLHPPKSLKHEPPRPVLQGTAAYYHPGSSPQQVIPSSSLHPPTATPTPHISVPLTSLPVNPYLHPTGSYTDPATNLVYPTERNGEVLSGLGQYVRTVFSVKVYGVALYVHSRDVLNSDMGRFKGRKSSELADDEEFYACLGGMDGCGGRGAAKAEGGKRFRRTIMLKLNMQLTTDTMRKSLEADWALLSEAHKTMLVESSFRARPAGRSVLDVLEAGGKCTCGQVPGKEWGPYDPSCCARGTELSFGWDGGDDLVVSLNGEVMDTFTDALMAKGIFYEYLREDDPISVEARARFVDGWPSLLAPLVQFHGDVPGFGTQREHVKKDGGKGGIGERLDKARDHAVANLDRGREQALNVVKATAYHVSRPKATAAAVAGFVGHSVENAVAEARNNAARIAADVERTVDRVVFRKVRVEGPLAQEEAEEEQPATEEEKNFLVVYAVHLYLILLLMVSLPTSSPASTNIAPYKRRRRSSGSLSPNSRAPPTPDLATISEGVELVRGRGLSVGEEGDTRVGMKKSLSFQF